MSVASEEAKDDNPTASGAAVSLSKNSTQNDSPGKSSQGQKEMAFAFVEGEALTEVPKDLYIPPDALEIFLETFEGPLDFLLYLIKRENIDILEINVADITDQYMAEVNFMVATQFVLA